VYEAKNFMENENYRTPFANLNIRNPTTSLGSIKNLVETPGVEPGSESDPSPESTYLVCVLDWTSGVHKQTSDILRRLCFADHPPASGDQLAR